MGKLQGQSAIITGGASGLGQGMAARFVAEGASVVIADIDPQRGGEVARELGPGARFIKTDVSDAAAIEAVVNETVAAHGKLDVMVNNAGFGGVMGGIAEIDIDGYDHTMNVLLRAVFVGMKYAARQMLTQGHGNIISTASVAGLNTSYSTPHTYNTAKAAVIQLTKSVAVELGPKNIRVNCLCPGFIATPIFAGPMDIPSQVRDKVPDAMAPFLAEMQPIRRAGQVEDIANAALWLASDEASFVTGHAMVVDGGITSGHHWQSNRGERAAHLRKALNLDEAQ